MAVKKKESPKPLASLFFTTFIGEYVQLTTNVMQSVSSQNEEQIVTQEIPVIVEGFLLDLDETYFYLGSSPDAVEHAVKNDSIIHIAIVNPKSELEEYLDSVEIPEDKESFN